MSFEVVTVVEPGFVRLTASGKYSFNEMFDSIDLVRSMADKADRNKVLIDCRQFEGSMTEAERFQGGQRVAEVFGAHLKAALIMPVGQVTKLGELTAVNRGANFLSPNLRSKPWIGFLTLSLIVNSGRTEVGKRAFDTFRLAGMAYLASVKDHPVRKHDPIIFWHQFFEIFFDLFRCFLLGQAEPLRQTRDVRVDDDARSNPKRISEHDVRCFSRNAAKSEYFIHRPGYFTAINLDQPLAGRLDVFRLIAEKTGRVNLSLQFFLRHVDEIPRAAVLTEECRRDNIYARVSALGR